MNKIHLNKHKHTHTYLIWDMCLSCENTEWEKSFLVKRPPHGDYSLSLLLCCPQSHLLNSVVNSPALLCFSNIGLEKPQTGRHRRALTARSIWLPSPSFFLQHHNLLVLPLNPFTSWVFFALLANRASVSLQGHQMCLCRLSTWAIGGVTNLASGVDSVPSTHRRYTAN